MPDPSLVAGSNAPGLQSASTLPFEGACLPSRDFLSSCRGFEFEQNKGSPMVRAVAAFWVAILCGLLVSLSANAANDNNAAALKKATADCQAQVKEYAKYNETSWYGRRKMIKQCVKGMPWRKG
jgi:hypothetical protein